MIDFHDLSWAAGVLDGCGRFQLVRHGTEVRSTRIYAPVDERTVTRLVRALGGRTSGRGWTLPANEQESVLQRVIPYLQIKGVEARACLQFRLTSPTRVIGWAVSDAVREYRGRIGR